MVGLFSLLAAVGFAAVAVWVRTRPRNGPAGRRYARLIALIFAASAVAYGAIGLGFGELSIGDTSVMWLHYAEWLVGTPAYVAGLFLLTGDRRTVGLAVAADLAMVATGFLAAASSGPRSEALFGVATLSLLGLFALLVSSEGVAGWRSEAYVRLRRLFLAVGWAYPVVWAVGADGAGLVGFGATNLGFLALDAVVKVGYLVVFVRWTPVWRPAGE